MSELVKEANYFGYPVKVHKTSASYFDPFPYTFSIVFEDGEHSFAGIPNRVDSIKKALKRAWYRCKWRKEKNYSKFYEHVVTIKELEKEE